MLNETKNTNAMHNTITTQNFESKKFSLKNAVSTFGAMNNPETWSASLHIFQFENESVECMVASYLTEQFQKELSAFKKKFKR